MNTLASPLHRMIHPILLPCALIALTTQCKSQDDVQLQPRDWHASVFGSIATAHTSDWMGPDLNYEAQRFGWPSLGIDLFKRHDAHWLWGGSAQLLVCHADALRWRKEADWTASVMGGDGPVAMGDQLGLDQRFYIIGPAIGYDLLPFPRQKRKGMTFKAMASVGYVLFQERSYMVHEAAVYEGSDGEDSYRYYHADLSPSNGSIHHGAALRLWIRSEWHIGQLVSCFFDLGYVGVTTFTVDGTTLSSRGDTYVVTPHRVSLSSTLVNIGLGVHF